MRRIVLGIAATALLLTACGQSGRVVDVGAAPSRSPDALPSAPARPDDASTAPAPPAASEAAPGTTQDGDAGADDLPGDTIDWPFTGEVGVVGVEADDVLNVRSAPGVDAAIVDRLDPLRRGLAYTGRARQLGESTWTQISVDGATGWVNGRFARLIAGTTDITAELVGPGAPITAPTMPALAEEVVAAYGLADGYRIVWGPDRDPSVPVEQQRRVVVSDGPRTGDLGEITVDVVDVFDDAVAAERLTVFGRPDGDGFGVRSVERTLFCWRGGDELCV